MMFYGMSSVAKSLRTVLTVAAAVSLPIALGVRAATVAVGADGGSKERATNRVVWERLPNPPLSADAKKLVGFYKLLYTDSYREKDGKEVFHGNRNYARAGTSYIIY